MIIFLCLVLQWHIAWFGRRQGRWAKACGETYIPLIVPVNLCANDSGAVTLTCRYIKGILEKVSEMEGGRSSWRAKWWVVDGYSSLYIILTSSKYETRKYIYSYTYMVINMSISFNEIDLILSCVYLFLCRFTKEKWLEMFVMALVLLLCQKDTDSWVGTRPSLIFDNLNFYVICVLFPFLQGITREA